jgi:hypothetical protein
MGRADFFIFGCSRAGAQSLEISIHKMMGLRIAGRIAAGALRELRSITAARRRDRGES